jgi:ubiquinone biosynthesis protein UbiJ
MEDITEMVAVAERMASHMNTFEARIIEQTDKLEDNVAKLQKQVDTLKK